MPPTGQGRFPWPGGWWSSGCGYPARAGAEVPRRSRWSCSIHLARVLQSFLANTNGPTPIESNVEVRRVGAPPTSAISRLDRLGEPNSSACAQMRWLNDDFDAAIVGAVFGVPVIEERSARSHSDGADLVAVDTTRYQVVTHGVRPVERKGLIDSVRTLAIGMAFDDHPPIRILRLERLGDLIELGHRRVEQGVLVRRKKNAARKRDDNATGLLFDGGNRGQILHGTGQLGFRRLARLLLGRQLFGRLLDLSGLRVAVSTLLFELLAGRGQRGSCGLHLIVANHDAGLDRFGDLLAIELGPGLDVRQLQLAPRNIRVIAAYGGVAVFVELLVRLGQNHPGVVQLGGSQLRSQPAVGCGERGTCLDQFGGGGGSTTACQSCKR